MIYEKTRRYIIPFEDVPSPRAEMPEISVEERRGSFREVETGFPEDVAMLDAKRCLSCRRCLGCALCWAECKPEAIDFSIPNEELDLDFDEVVLTKGQDNGFDSLNKDMGFGDYPHVITDLQFERMLSPTGPTDGLVVSPLDGEIPSRIAVVQAHPSEEEGHLFSSVVLGVNESIIALDRTEGLEMTVVSPLSDEFKDSFMKEVETISGLNVIEAAPISVGEGDKEGLLALVYGENGEEKKEAFDMIVLLTKPKIPAEIQSLSRKLEQDII